MNRLAFSAFYLVLAVVFLLGGCAGPDTIEASADNSFLLEKPELSGHVISDIVTNSDECTILTDQHGPVGTCLVGNDGNILVADWRIDPGWVIESVSVYAAPQPPPTTIEYIQHAPVVLSTQITTPQLNVIETGPATGISLSDPETQLPPSINVSPAAVPISNLCQLPYLNDDLQVTDKLKLSFSLAECDPGTRLYILSELTVTNGTVVVEARVVDFDGNEVIEQYYRPVLNLPEGEIPACAGTGGRLHEETQTFPEFFVSFGNIPEGLSIEPTVAYPGWCAQMTNAIDREDSLARVYNSLDPNLPDHLRGTNWNAINYCLNHYQDHLDQGQGLQSSIWYFTDGMQLAEHYNCKKLVNAALQHGLRYVPGVGDYVVVIIDRSEDNQDTIIPVIVGEPENPTE